MPPTIHQLLQDPVIKTMYRTIPEVPPSLAWGQPWQLWAVTHEGRWGTKRFATYREVWSRAVELIRNPDKYADVSIVSRRVLYPPPPFYDWTTREGRWCCRCRRPSEFRTWPDSHHALRSQPALATDEPYRCYYCGIRRAGQPHYLPWRGY
jgi:hypothetical protein